MINEKALRDILVHLTKRQKSIYKTLTVTMAESASLREAVRALDPTSQKREEFHLKLSETYESEMSHYDDLIEILERGDVC